MSNNQQHGGPDESSGLIEEGQQEPDELEKKTNKSSFFSIGVGVTITVLLVVVGVFLISGTTNASNPSPSSDNKGTQAPPIIQAKKVDSTVKPDTVIKKDQSYFTPIYHSSETNVSANFKPFKFRPQEMGQEKVKKVYVPKDSKIESTKKLDKAELGVIDQMARFPAKHVSKMSRAEKEAASKIKGKEEDMRITANGIRSPHPKDDWDPPMPIPEEKDFLDHLKTSSGERIPGLISNENQKEDIFTDIIVKDVIDNPYPYFIDEGITETKRANPGCAVIYEDTIHKGHTRFVRICLTGKPKIQTIMIPTEQLSIPHEYVGVVAGKDTYVSFFQNGEPKVSMGPYQFFHTNEHKYYDHIHITFLQDAASTNIDRTIVEITGKIFTPPPCITFANTNPLEDPDSKSMVICGKPGRNMFHASKKKLKRLGVTMADKGTAEEGLDIGWVQVGMMAEVDLYTTPDYTGPKIHLSHKAGVHIVANLVDTPTFLDPVTKVATSWNKNVKSLLCSFE